MTNTNTTFDVNNRTYHLPAQPVAVICIDGCADEYLSVSIAKGKAPNIARMAAEGYRGMARGALPSFTNVNNGAIVTGVAPKHTGICGNFFYDVLLGIRSHSRTRSKLRWVAHFVPGFQNRRRVIGLLHRTSVGPR